MLVLAACWAAAADLIPALHEALELYHPIFSTATFALMVTHCTWSQLMGGLRVGSFWEPIILPGNGWAAGRQLLGRVRRPVPVA
eukprot:967644-Pelagomonas_calceolata.AAC.1